MTRWHHGHATLVGVVLGLLVASHVWLVFVLGLALGLMLNRLRRAATVAAAYVASWRRPASEGAAGRQPTLRGLR